MLLIFLEVFAFLIPYLTYILYHTFERFTNFRGLAFCEGFLRFTFPLLHIYYIISDGKSKVLGQRKIRLTKPLTNIEKFGII